METRVAANFLFFVVVSFLYICPAGLSKVECCELKDEEDGIKHTQKSLAGFHRLSVPEMISHRKYYKLLF